MFRKPKKKPSALRGTGRSGGTSSASGLGEHHASDSNSKASLKSSAGKKRRRVGRNFSSSEEDNNDEEGTSDLLQQIRQERDGSKSKKSNSSSLLNTSSTTTKNKSKDNKNSWMHQYKSNDSRMTAQDMATRTAEYHPTESTQSSKSPVIGADGEKTLQKNASSQNAQIAALQKQPRNKFLAGPLRATTFVRTTARFDYQPDICKDYKETGFCGFGDTCIYLHDRGDTKSGWQMEQEYEEKKKRDEEKKSKEMEHFMNLMMCGEVSKDGTLQSISNPNDEQQELKSDDGIPFACHICRGPFENPVVTTCGHYFCEKCLLTRIREVGTGCPVCQKDTHGVMNHAQKLVAKKRRLVGRDGTWEGYLEKRKHDII